MNKKQTQQQQIIIAINERIEMNSLGEIDTRTVKVTFGRFNKKIVTTILMDELNGTRTKQLQ